MILRLKLPFLTHFQHIYAKKTDWLTKYLMKVNGNRLVKRSRVTTERWEKLGILCRDFKALCFEQKCVQLFDYLSDFSNLNDINLEEIE